METEKKHWLALISENMVGIIAFLFTIFTFTVYTIILLKVIKTTETTTTIILNSVTNMELLILGFYYVSSKSNKDKDKQIADMIANKVAPVDSTTDINIKKVE